MRIGRLHSSKLLRDCENGMSRRTDSNGTVDASWYFPSSDESEQIKQVFCVMNLRGDATEHHEQAKWLFGAVNLVFIMIELGSIENKRYLKFVDLAKSSKAQFVVCFVSDRYERAMDSFNFLEQCQASLKKNAVQVVDVLLNWNEERLLSVGEWRKDVRDVIVKYLKVNNARSTIVKLADTVSGLKFTVDEKEPLCENDTVRDDCMWVSRHVIELSKSIKDIDPTKRKLCILPLQGALWRQWGKLQKQLFRNKMPSQEFEKFLAQKNNELFSVRKDQLHAFARNSTNSFVVQFSNQLNKLKHGFADQYFIIWVQIIFNSWSVNVIPALHDKYYAKLKQYREQRSESSVQENKKLSEEIGELASDIENASLGIEHIFREFGQIFEAFQSYQAPDTRRLAREIHVGRYPEIVANLMLQGSSFELMDGDAAFVPIVWVKAVFEALKRIIGDKKLFIISVVGIQSSGKSTLLNTMFGLKFAVSAGRCTRGVYCLLIPVDEKSMKVGYDYMLIIDTEGLRAPELEDAGLIHDNELATLVVGLGDVTIVNIKGENSMEINDILQIVIHAMIRIKLVKPNLLKPSCIFVHQNVPAVDANEKLKISQEKLLAKLDKITASAAEDEKVAYIRHFKDVIDYDETSQVFYMPDLWQGQPPMAPVNWGYSEKINKIKELITKNIASKSKPITITSFIDRISDLWNAILSENFVFSFKNSQEVRAFSHLDKTFTQFCWNFKDVSLSLQVYCENVLTYIMDSEQLEESKTALLEKIESDLGEKYTSVQKELSTYFDEHEQKEILIQWRGRYEANLNNLYKDEKSQIKAVLNASTRMKAAQLETTNKAALFCRERILEIAMQTAKQLQENDDEEYSDDALYEYFHEKWIEWLTSFGNQDHPKDVKNEIISTFTEELHNSFSFHMNLLRDELKENPIDSSDMFDFSSVKINIDREDLDYCREGKGIYNVMGYQNECMSIAAAECLNVQHTN